MAQEQGIQALEQHMPFQKRSWTVQRVGWAIMTLIVVAALVGVFGGSGLVADTASSSTDNRLRVEYKRFTRLLTPNRMVVEITNDTPADETRLLLDQAYTDALYIIDMNPEPDQEIMADEGTIFVFQNQALSSQIIIDVKPVRAGSIGGQMTIEGGSSLTFSQFVFP